MAGSPIVIWVVLSGLALIDIVLCRITGLRFTGWSRVLTAGPFLAGVALFYGLGGRSLRLASMAHWILLWLVFTLTGAILTYLAATCDGRLYDGVFSAIDARFGFDWQAWFDFVVRHPPLHLLLAFAYASLMPQIVLSVLYFSWRGQDRRNGELLASAIVALLMTTALFSLLPALGPGVGVPALANTYLADLTTLRAGVAATFDLVRIEGIIVFPSFHAVLATLLTYAHRGGPGFAPVAVVNAIMLLSIPNIGGHYLTDIPAGIAVAGVAILATRAARLRRRGVAPAPAA